MRGGGAAAAAGPRDVEDGLHPDIECTGDALRDEEGWIRVRRAEPSEDARRQHGTASELAERDVEAREYAEKPIVDRARPAAVPHGRSLHSQRG